MNAAEAMNVSDIVEHRHSNTKRINVEKVATSFAHTCSYELLEQNLEMFHNFCIDEFHKRYFRLFWMNHKCLLRSPKCLPYQRYIPVRINTEEFHNAVFHLERYATKDWSDWMHPDKHDGNFRGAPIVKLQVEYMRKTVNNNAVYTVSAEGDADFHVIQVLDTVSKHKKLVLGPDNGCRFHALTQSFEVWEGETVTARIDGETDVTQAGVVVLYCLTV